MKYLLTIFTLLVLTSAQAQEVSMADSLRNDGKIWVVVAVFLSVLALFFVFMILLDRRLTRLERNQHETN